MAQLNPHTISDVNVYLDGKGFLGIVKELELPKIEKEIRSQENAGVTRPVDLGIFKELNLSFMLQQARPEIAAMLALSNQVDTSLILKAAIRDGSKTIAFTGLASGIVKSYELPKLGPKQDLETKIEIALKKFAYSLDGKQAMLFDTENIIAIIDGIDLLADVRASLL